MKNKIVCKLLMAGMAFALLLSGCSKNTQDVSAQSEIAEETTADELSASQMEGEKDDEALSDIDMLEVDPLSTKWTVVRDVAFDHASNMEGFLNENYGLTVGFSGEIHYTTDGGKTWPKGENSSMCRFCLDIKDENLAWCGGNGDNIRVTVDGGETWTAVTNTLMSGTHSHISFVDEMSGWVCTSYKLSTTNDGGETWTKPTLPEGVTQIATINLLSKDNGYLFSQNGLLFHTTDGGETWTKTDISKEVFGKNVDNQIRLAISNTASVAMTFMDENNGRMVFRAARKGEDSKVWVLYTSDGGKTWDREEIPLLEGYKTSRVYLSEDGQYITLGDSGKRILVLKYEE